MIKVLTQGTDTAFVGELMNLMGSVCFVLTASLIYRKMHTKKGAVIGMTFSSVLVSILFIFLNMYIAFPMYSALYGMPLDTIISMGTSANPFEDDSVSFMQRIRWRNWRNICMKTRSHGRTFLPQQSIIMRCAETGRIRILERNRHSCMKSERRPFMQWGSKKTAILPDRKA